SMTGRLGVAGGAGMDCARAKAVRVNNRIAREARKMFFKGMRSFRAIGQRGKALCAGPVWHSNLELSGRTTSNSHRRQSEYCLLGSCCRTRSARGQAFDAVAKT